MAGIREFMIEIGVVMDNRQIGLFGRYMDRAKTAFDYARKAAIAFAAGIGIASAALAGYVATVAIAIDNTYKQATAFLMDPQRFQGLEYAFTQLGATTDDLQDALGTLTDRARDAIEGNKTYAKEFARIGIAVSELRNKKPGELFDLYIQKAQQAKDKTVAIASAVRLFGDDLGRRILPALVGGSMNIEKMIKQAEEAGYILGTQAVKDLREFGLAMRLLQLRAMGLGRYFASQLAPGLKKLSQRVTKVIIYFTDFMKVMAKIAGRMFQEELEKLTDLWHDLFDVIGWMGGLKPVFTRVLKFFTLFAALGAGHAFKKLAKYLAMIAARLIAVNFATLAGGLGIAAALAIAILSVVLVLDDLYTTFKGGDSVLNRWIQQGGFLGETAQEFVWAMQFMMEAVRDAIKVLDQMLASMGIGKGVMEILLAAFMLIGFTLITLVVVAILAAVGAVIAFILAIKGLISYVQEIYEWFLKLYNVIAGKGFFERLEAFRAMEFSGPLKWIMKIAQLFTYLITAVGILVKVIGMLADGMINGLAEAFYQIGRLVNWIIGKIQTMLGFMDEVAQFYEKKLKGIGSDWFPNMGRHLSNASDRATAFWNGGPTGLGTSQVDALNAANRAYRANNVTNASTTTNQGGVNVGKVELNMNSTGNARTDARVAAETFNNTVVNNKSARFAAGRK